MTPPNAERPGTGCPCDPFGSDGLQCPGPDGRPLCCTPASAASVGGMDAFYFRELMAVMHADGGHFLAEHGAQEAHAKALAHYYALLASRPAPAVTPVAGAGNYVQDVPDHCDRIIWRSRYYGLSQDGAAPEAAVSVGVTDAEVDAVIGCFYDNSGNLVDFQCVGEDELRLSVRAALEAFTRLRASGQEGAV